MKIERLTKPQVSVAYGYNTPTDWVERKSYVVYGCPHTTILVPSVLGKGTRKMLNHRYKLVAVYEHELRNLEAACTNVLGSSLEKDNED